MKGNPTVLSSSNTNIWQRLAQTEKTINLKSSNKKNRCHKEKKIYIRKKKGQKKFYFEKKKKKNPERGRKMEFDYNSFVEFFFSKNLF